MLCTVIRIESAVGQSFQALAPTHDAGLNPDPQESTPPVVTLIGDWVYGSGTKPAIGSPEGVTISAAASKIVLHRIPAAGTNPARIRAILLETTTGYGATVAAGAASVPFDVDEYVDAILDGNGAFDRFDGPHAFDEDNDPDSASTIEVIKEQRAARGIP